MQTVSLKKTLCVRFVGACAENGAKPKVLVLCVMTVIKKIWIKRFDLGRYIKPVGGIELQN